MKRILTSFVVLVVILALVLSIGCSSTQETITTTGPAVTVTSTSTAVVAATTTTTTTPPVIKLSSITVTPASPADLPVDSTQAFIATGTYSNGSTSQLFSATWTSDNPSVATIDRNGVVTGVALGETNITATQFGITSPAVSLTVIAASVPTPTSVYVSVSVDGVLLVAAQSIAYTKDMTLEDVVKAAHTAYYADGLNGYQADESKFGAGYYIINKCWGVENTPCIVINDHLNSEKVFQSVKVIKVKANDNIIICTVQSGGTLAPVSMKAVKSGGQVTITALSWTMNPADYTWSSKPCKNANVLDSEGNVLGTTDDNGQITIDIPADSIVIIEGFAAINVTAATS